MLGIFKRRSVAWRGILALAVTVTAPVTVGFAKEPVVLRRGNDSEPASLDPHRGSNTWENNIIGDLFMGLTTDDPEAKPIPGTAESWTVSPDGLVWTFKLRPGLRWSDGVDFKASDVVFGFRQELDPKTAAKYAFILYVVKNAEAINSGKMPLEALGIRALDDRTVEITVEAPTPFLPGLLTHYASFPIPEHVYKKFGDDWAKPGNMVSNGAYTLAAWIANDHIKIVKNPLFFDAKNVAIDEVIFTPLDDDSAALSRYRAGEIDVNLSRGSFPMRQFAWVKENLPGQGHLTPQLSVDYLVFNQRHPPFNDGRVRKAVSLCIDRKIIADKVLMDGSVAAGAFVPPGIANYHNTAKQDFVEWPMEQRRAEAQRLLTEAGYSSKHPLAFEYKHMTTAAGRRQAITESAMLKQCGIVARLYGNESKIHYASVQQFDFEFAWAGWVADYNDPQNFLFLLESSSKAYNYGGYHNAEFDRLMDEAKDTLDIEKRAAILARAEQIALDDNPVIPVEFSTHRVLVQPYVKGYVDNPVNIHRDRWMRIER